MNRSGLTIAGALTTAGSVAATTLCCLPFAAGVAGTALAAAGTRLAPLRPFLGLASLALLAWVFREAYRPAAGTTCGANGCAAGRPRRRLAAWILAGVVVLLLTASWWADRLIYWTL